ncbi:KEOPS complex kinase/ATPase Bud32 [Caldivirga maquilingensis]|uniref:non-specific serine/threonine protein kinase n=1 Tax=Caldivirga maquilingensis (strain ATCC 700844 / DSM 13496 / JCM 10307 / IC-167) TaxID=397948 RepID=A8MCN5_CALMQ|nr:KEOPS complex kinase/ATPase Bud32 [Caldivirga maquilingensis]ABW01541.1 Mn2+-dependent serine/threonine protein kinase [Caldivirga maquilingensis IC-167]
MKVIAKGAEALLYLEDWLGLIVLVKERVPKGYRDPVFDKVIRVKRTINEARLMMDAADLGVKTPVVYDVDVVRTKIRMQYLNSPTLNTIIKSNGYSKLVKELMSRMGALVGVLHNGGILHGDPTPANVIVNDSDEYLIDFGLGEKLKPTWDSKYLRKTAVDLNVLLRSLESNYGEYSEQLFNDFINGYSSVIGGDKAASVVKWVRRIRSLARYYTGRLL